MTSDITYHGNCHCGAFKYTVTIPPITAATICNCSICSRYDAFFHFPPTPEHLKITKGSIEDTLTAYRWGKKFTTFYFCKTCGTELLALVSPATGVPPERVLGLNIRSLHDLDLTTLSIKKFDGSTKRTENVWTPYTFPHALPASSHIHTGSCHCGDVKIAVAAPPELAGVEVRSCNCSICRRRGELWFYPAETDISVEGKDKMTKYTFGNKYAQHGFCKTCGVSVVNYLNGEIPELGPVVPVNTRALNGLNISELEAGAKKADGAAAPPIYVVPE